MNKKNWMYLNRQHATSKGLISVTGKGLHMWPLQATISYKVVTCITPSHFLYHHYTSSTSSVQSSQLLTQVQPAANSGTARPH